MKFTKADVKKAIISAIMSLVRRLLIDFYAGNEHQVNALHFHKGKWNKINPNTTCVVLMFPSGNYMNTKNRNERRQDNSDSESDDNTDAENGYSGIPHSGNHMNTKNRNKRRQDNRNNESDDNTDAANDYSGIPGTADIDFGIRVYRRLDYLTRAQSDYKPSSDFKCTNMYDKTNTPNNSTKNRNVTDVYKSRDKVISGNNEHSAEVEKSKLSENNCSRPNQNLLPSNGNISNEIGTLSNVEWYRNWLAKNTNTNIESNLSPNTHDESNRLFNIGNSNGERDVYDMNWSCKNENRRNKTSKLPCSYDQNCSSNDDTNNQAGSCFFNMQPIRNILSNNGNASNESSEFYNAQNDMFSLSNDKNAYNMAKTFVHNHELASNRNNGTASGNMPHSPGMTHTSMPDTQNTQNTSNNENDTASFTGFIFPSSNYNRIQYCVEINSLMSAITASDNQQFLAMMKYIVGMKDDQPKNGDEQPNGDKRRKEHK